MRLSLFIVIIIIALSLPFPFFIIAVLLYVTRYTGYELLPVALCIDAQFGSSSLLHGYIYVASVGFLILSALLIKPLLNVYSDT